MEYTVQAVERATGVAGSRLRTWERRYGIPAPPRSATGRRLYTESDVRLVRRMAALIEAGLSAAQAADEARSGGDSEPMSAPPAAAPVSPLAGVLVDAAQLFEVARVDALLGSAFRDLGASRALSEVVFPALRLAGDRWATGQVTVAQEHLLAEAVRTHVAAQVAAVGPVDSGAIEVLLAGPEGELHDMVLSGFRLLLAQAGVSACSLGSNVPASALVDAVESMRPAVVLLSATSSAALPTLGLTARALMASRWRGRLLFGGAALASDEGTTRAIPGTRLPTRFDEAAAAVVSAATAARGGTADR